MFQKGFSDTAKTFRVIKSNQPMTILKTSLLVLSFVLFFTPTAWTAEEKLVQYHTNSQGVKAQGFLVTPDVKGQTPAILMIHDWSGLDENVKQQARKYADAGYTVFAIDTFDGKNPATREIAEPIVRNLYKRENHRVVFRNMNSGLAYLERLPNVAPDRIAVLGWGYGAV